MNILEKMLQWKVEQVLAHLQSCESAIKYR